MARKQRTAEEAGGPPAWIVSFSDMVTLLLAFFVLLQSFAKIRDPELFFIGQGSFKRAIAGLGIPEWLFGRQDRPRRSFVNVKHPTEQGPETRPKPRIIDAENEKIRNMFADLQKDFDIAASDLTERPISVEAASIAFAAGAADLDAAAEKVLAQRVLEWRQTLGAAGVRVRVIGLAAEQSEPADQWAVSARRAGAVEARLRRLLGAEENTRGWQVHSWGAGPGGAWCETHGIIPSRTSIVIVITKETGRNG